MTAYDVLGLVIGSLLNILIVAFYLMVLVPIFFLRDLCAGVWRSVDRQGEWRITRALGLLGLALDLVLIAACAAGLS